MNNPLTVEIVIFTLKPRVSEASFLQASTALLPDLQRMSGYVRRELMGENYLIMISYNALAQFKQTLACF
jgi:hypothetical protein